MKKCRFCAEEIQDEAIKCRFCGEFLEASFKPKPPTKWYYSTAAIVTSLLVVGPFALPLVWYNPKYTLVTKIIITVVVLGGTYWLCLLTGQMYQRMMKQINDFGIQ